MQILEIRFFQVRKGPNIGTEPNFHDPIAHYVKWLRLSRTTENGLDFNIEGNGQPPLKMKILKICFFFMLERVQIQALSQIFMTIRLQMTEIIPDNRKLAHF